MAEIMAATEPLATALKSGSRPLHVAVIGAGAFGGWTALFLQRSGAKVTLVDAWGPGNSRASSGGETRVIRGTYGDQAVYTKMSFRALQLWQEYESRWRRKLYRRTGALWMVVDAQGFEEAAIPHLREAGFTFEKLSADEGAHRYPQINFDGVSWALLENEAGYLLARQSCATVLDGFLKEGGKYLQSAVKPGSIQGSLANPPQLSDGSVLRADAYVYACGPWLGKLFPDVIGNLIHPTRQEVYFFGPAAGDTRYDEDHHPVWMNHGQVFYYGIPGNERRGFKVADDTRGPEFNPTDGERNVTPENLQQARKFLEFRFPGLKNAPLLEARVCQYENSPDQHLIVDRHPQADNVWFLGGGSGHGFKHGPALGEFAASVVLGKTANNPQFLLSRFRK
jgi:glycine/D-amino acid oxidase-like deaminating enzyme